MSISFPILETAQNGATSSQKSTPTLKLPSEFHLRIQIPSSNALLVRENGNLKKKCNLLPDKKKILKQLFNGSSPFKKATYFDIASTTEKKVKPRPLCLDSLTSPRLSIYSPRIETIALCSPSPRAISTFKNPWEKDLAPVDLKHLSTIPESESPTWDPNPSVIAGHLSSCEQEFMDEFLESIRNAQDPRVSETIRNQLISRLTRATYIVTHINSKSRELITEFERNHFFDAAKKVGLVIAHYLGFDESNAMGTNQSTPLAYIVRQLAHPIATFKPGDEVRGGLNHLQKDQHAIKNLPGKLGIDHGLESLHELLASAFFPLKQPVVEVTIPGPFTYLGTPRAPKRGVAIGYLHEMVEFSQIPDKNKLLNSISERDLHQLAIMDIALCNSDRNSGNLMINLMTKEIGMIDHANILPAQFQSSGVFVWQQAKKASSPFNEESLKQIADLDFARDSAKIQQYYPNYPEENLYTMRVSYQLLKKGAAAGLTPFQIACFLTGDDKALRLVPMHRIYLKADELAGGNRDERYALMSQWIDDMVGNLKTNPLLASLDKEAVEDLLNKSIQ